MTRGNLNLQHIASQYSQHSLANDIHNFFEHVLLDSINDPKQIVDDIYEAHQYFKCNIVCAITMQKG